MPDNKNDEIKKARREYYRNWRAKNPERVKAIQDRFWRRQAAKRKASPGIPEDAEIR